MGNIYFMKKAIFIIGSLLLFFACGKDKKEVKKEVSTDVPKEVVKVFPQLEGGEFFLKNKNPFGEIIELNGKNITGDTVMFSLKETEMLIKDGYLIMKNLMATPTFRIFKLEDLKQVAAVGQKGQGPDDFLFPTLVPTEDKDLLCYIFDSAKDKLFALDKQFQLTPMKEPFLATEKEQFSFAEKQMTNIGKSDFIYVDNSKTGKSIFRTYKKGDSIVTEEIFNLALNPKRKSPFNYIGSFAVNTKKNRMVYGYKYFKMLKFMDLEGETVRTINFERDTFDEKSIYKVNGLDQNTTHYWKIAAGNEYVYLLYSGRTPSERVKEIRKGINFIYVEQYDWNGNPIKKYKLDEWGYFTVDEKNKKVILTSFNFDEPFLEYQLP